jgi:16S rRNA (uracil1498-N3)-methyltransferase
MNRFFVESIENESAVLSGGDYKHCKSVLRLKEESEIFLVCNGKEYVGIIKYYEDNKVICKILSQTGHEREADIKINLYQCMPKADKMEMIIQKNVELGVYRIIPLISMRTVVKLSEKHKTIKKLERWNKISEEAAKQSMRNIVPLVDNILTFDEMISRFKQSKQLLIVPYENENNLRLKDLDLKSDEINLLIGPEGGFDPKEIEKLETINTEIVTLGPRILRTETAALVANSVIMYKTNNI